MGVPDIFHRTEPLCQVQVILLAAAEIVMPFAEPLNNTGDAADLFICPCLQHIEIAFAVCVTEKPLT